jgi:hypothetical protein
LVGVRVSDDTEFATETEYEVVEVAKLGDSDPLEIAKADKVESEDAFAST